MKDGEPKPIPFIDHLPRPARAFCALSGLALATACGQGAPPKEETELLGQPFPADKNMNIQQGFLDDDGVVHRGIDYIKGNIDQSSSWLSFPVLAAADGQACLNPPKREGNAVFIQHIIKNIPFHSYSGHLVVGSSKDIPECNTGQTKSVKKGEKIGDAGSTGTEWLHLHFQVNDFQGNPVDPFDLNAKRDKYPDPNFINGKNCGPKALFAKCYEQKGVIIGAPGPNQRTQVDEIKAVTITPTVKPIIPTPTIRLTETPKPIQESLPTATFIPERTNDPLSNTAMTQALAAWVQMLTRTDQYNNFGITGIVRTSLLSTGQITLVKYALETKSNVPSPDKYRSYNTYTTGLLRARDLTIEVSSIQPLTSADRANGMRWNGQVKVRFIQQARYTFSRNAIPTLPDENGKFSDWSNQERAFGLVEKNGQWTYSLAGNGWAGGNQPFHPEGIFLDCQECSAP